MKTKAFYTAITTQDIEKTLAFYVGVLDFRVVHNLTEGEGMSVVLENDAGARLELRRRARSRLGGPQPLQPLQRRRRRGHRLPQRPEGPLWHLLPASCLRTHVALLHGGKRRP